VKRPTAANRYRSNKTNFILYIHHGVIFSDLDSIPGKAETISIYHRVQTVPRAYPASYPMGTGGTVKRPGREADYSP